MTADQTQPHDAIQMHAYHLWEQRGKPWGSPEIDWFTAESRFHPKPPEAGEDSPTIAMAKVVGSVLGSVAGLVTSLTHPPHSDQDF